MTQQAVAKLQDDPELKDPNSCQKKSNAGALLIRIGFGGILYYNSNKEPPKPY